MKAGRNLRKDLLALLALATIGLTGYFLSPLRLPTAAISAVAEPGCDLHRKSCSAYLPDGGRIDLSILPRPIPMVADLQVEVKLSGIEADKVAIDLAGVDMDMGPNRTALAALSSTHFRGSATIPVCITGNMLWQATVLIETRRQRIAAPFRFNSRPTPA